MTKLLQFLMNENIILRLDFFVAYLVDINYLQLGLKSPCRIAGILTSYLIVLTRLSEPRKGHS